ncbi:TCP-1/cpn60 chaperonin family protein [Sinorhizobium medicae]|uniref:TCP-1/cpn60 chaperonin family protein n=1 Tax=Sinorhizobium medicae TaxID=110321 RepID=UPI000C7B8F49|nr:TCP-1/cpn60 chaperonin family protein [Sinorhizobium medicae]PLU17182.1 hypothetical protein BMJ29_21870 [Sinorhizobium medicae]PLU81500.1 hypothetical protein BMJ19_02185 [Sinorhizobium medicae]
MNKAVIMHGHEARMGILRGMSSALEAAQMTYGPCGWTVAIDYHAPQIRSTKCGASVLEEFGLIDPCEDAGAHLLCHVARQVQKYAGDGTTLASILAYGISAETYRQNVMRNDYTEVCRGIRIASQMVEQFITETSRPISGSNDLYAVAHSASGLDKALAELVVQAFTSVQDPSAVFLQSSETSSFEVVNGLLLDAYSHDRFDHPCKSVLLADPGVAIYPGSLETWDQISHDLQKTLASGADVLIVAQHICPTFRGTVPTEIDRCRLHLISMVRSRLPYTVETLQDIFRTRHPSFNRRIVIGNDRVFIELSNADFTSGCAAAAPTPTALISIGEIGDTASLERMERAVQCAASVRAALKDGCVPGGAAILVDAARWLGIQQVDDSATSLGIEILRRALISPAQILIDSAGELGGHHVENMLSHATSGLVFDLRERSLRSAEAAGVLDATAIIIAAIRVSSSIAALIALTEVVVSQHHERDRDRRRPLHETHH